MSADSVSYFGKGTIRKNIAEKERKPFSVFKFVCTAVKTLIKISILVCLIFVFFICIKLYKKYYPTVESYYRFAMKVVEDSSPSDFKMVQTSYVYDSAGRQLAKLKTDKDVYYVKYTDLPRTLIEATVAIEDRRFWEHSGVDYLSTGKAALLYLKDRNNIVRGGSTITQQLIKNVYLNRSKNLERKLKEIFIALEFEQRYTKEQILEYYLNNINYANGYYGIGAAAKGYFNKSVGELTLEEIAFLSAIPNNPSLYDPIENTKNTTKRRNIILKTMCEQGYINEEEYLMASNSPIHFHKKASKNYNYEVSYAIDCAVRILMKEHGFKFKYDFKTKKKYKAYLQSYGESYQLAKTELYTGGYRVYTSIDRKVQNKLQKSINEHLKAFKEKDKDRVYKLQGAATVVDNSTGMVTAIVGGRSQNFNGIITLNRAYQSYRQPGSSFKPLAVYTPSFEFGYNPNTKVDDSYWEGGPHNSGNSYSGEIKLRTAVEKSKNVVAWQVMEDVGVEACLSYVKSMQFAKIVPADVTLSASLGGLTYGVTTVEMAGGYQTLFNDGVYREPTCIERIELSSGVKINFTKEEHRVYSVEAARTMTDVLQGVAKRGTAKGLTVGKLPIACKTGTTNGQTNGWFCGYTPYYTVVCYVGYDDNKSLSSLWGSTYPMQIWQDVQLFLNKGLPFRQFQKPEKSKVDKNKKMEGSGDSPESSTLPLVPAKTPDNGPSYTPDTVVVTPEPIATAEPIVPIIEPVEETEEPSSEEFTEPTEEPVILEETEPPVVEPTETPLEDIEEEEVD